MNKPTLAVATVNYNKSDYTLNLIKSLERSTFRDIKVFVIDNCSSEEDIMNLVDRCAKSCLDIMIIQNKSNSGWGSGLNLAFEEINKENIPYTLVINNDTQLKYNTISLMMEVITKDKKIGICGPKILNNDGTIQTIGGILNWKVKYLGITTNNPRQYLTETTTLSDNETLDDCCWIIRSDIMKQVHYEPHLFLYFEEFYIILGARALGYKLAYVPSAEISHYGQASTREAHESKSMFQVFYLNRNRIIFIKDKFPKIFPLFLPLCLLVTVPLLLIKYSLKREWSSVKQILLGTHSGLDYSLFGKETYFKK